MAFLSRKLAWFWAGATLLALLAGGVWWLTSKPWEPSEETLKRTAKKFAKEFGGSFHEGYGQLELSNTKVTDSALKELGSFKKILKVLQLQGTQVTDSGLKELAGMRLKYLSIP